MAPLSVCQGIAEQTNLLALNAADDRLFVYLRTASSESEALDAAVDALVAAGHPAVRIDIDDPYDIGQEFFRWEVATAVAGTVLRINPFDQPDVEGAKVAVRRMANLIKHGGQLPRQVPIAEHDGVSLYAGFDYAHVLHGTAGRSADSDRLIDTHLQQAKPGDYVAFLCYLNQCACPTFSSADRSRQDPDVGRCAKATG